VFKPPGAAPIGSVWVTLFDAQRGPVALKERVPPERLRVPADAYVAIGDSVLRPGRLEGAASAAGEGARWQLSYDASAPAFAYLSAPWLYHAPLPRTKPCLPYPAIAVSGQLEIAGRRVTLDCWPGIIGHNWGSEHPARASWIHGAGFAGEPDARLDVVLARVRVGPLLTPWIANGLISLDGRTHRLGGLRPRGSRFAASPTGARFLLRGAGIVVRGDVGAPRERFVGWRYSDPSTGSWHPTVNCSIADMDLVVTVSPGPERHLTLAGGAAYELQLAEHDHGVPLQPFPDP
jgi:hypothetical protein